MQSVSDDLIERLRPEPAEHAEPQHDYILVREMSEYEMTSRGGIIMPDVTDPTGNKRSSGRFEVMAVGPGPWTDRVAAEGEARFLRRPMSVRKGDHVVFQGGGFLINAAGRQLIAIQDYQIVAVYRNGSKLQ